MKIPLLISSLCLVLLSGCAAFATPSPTSTPTAIPTSTSTQTNTPSPTPLPSLTPMPATATRAPTRTRTSTPDYTPTVTATPGPPRAGMQLIFADEFDGNQLDTTKWNPCYPWDNKGCTNSGNNEEEWYLPDEILVENGLLRLRGRPNPVQGSDGKAYPYTAGMVSSHDKFSATYGYFEMRAKMPKGRGLWPAFWLLPQTREWPPEIDVLEVLGHDINTVYTTLHYKTAGVPHLSSGKSTFLYPTDLSQGFHTYAVDWGPEWTVWYFDGRELFRVSANLPHQPMYVIANLAVGGNWPGSPDKTTVFPAYFDIDYIRVYRDPAMPTPTITVTSQPQPTTTQTPSATSESVVLPLPEDPPLAEWSGVPVMPAAIAGQDDGNSYMFTIKASPQEIQAYYEKELKKQGWNLLGVGEGKTKNVMLIFMHGADSLSIAIIDAGTGDGVFQVLMVK